MPLARVLVVEDDDAIRRGVCDALAFHGYAVLEAAEGVSGLETASSAAVDLVLLDVLMPGLDGMTVLERLRRVRPALPVIFLTARGEQEDKVRGLRLGADDYVVKPFGASELIARVEAVLRRSAERPQPLRTLSIAGCTMDFERRELTRADGTRAVLPEREAELLAYLAHNRGRAISRDELLLRVWGIDPRGMQTRTVDMAVARLREQLRDDAAEPRFIVTVRGRGYMLAAVPEGAEASP
ncbi:MAG TPA: response regulator transcription factor [Phycisphaerales bacterium]|nr:response regulator transcription factor [Phycisphaerales bacterium]